MEHDLLAAIDESCSLYLYPNAIFLAERLYARYATLQNLHVLAKVYADSGDWGSCHRLLRMHAPFAEMQASLQDPSRQSFEAAQRSTMYLFGVSCVQTNRFTDAERIFADVVPSVDGAAEYWLGVCARRLGRQNAHHNFAESIQRNPNLFVSFEEYLKQKAGSLSQNYYNDLLQFVAESSAAHSNLGPVAAPAPAAATTAVDAATRHTSSSRFSAPPPPKSIPTHVAPASLGHSWSSSGSSSTTSVFNATSGGPLGSRKSSTVRPSTGYSSPTTNGSATRSNSSTPPPPPPPSLASGGEQHPGLSAPQPHDRMRFVQFLSVYAEALVLYYSYQCSSAIKFLLSDAITDRDSGWVLIHTALSFFHSGSMQDARDYFHRLRHVEPWRLNDTSLVYYSTALWHLKDESNLSLLAQQLIEEAPLHPVTLCVSGNCYSLAKDNRMAIQMLARATSVDKTFAYAHTLHGYELLAADQKTEAEAAFTQALARDPKHYIAYAGLGETALRKDSINKAQHYFSLATGINKLPAIMNRLASTYHRRGATQDSLRRALDVYDACLHRNPGNVGARHQRAEVLMKLKRYEEALHELEKLKADCPEEAMLYVTLGRCCHRLSRIANANQYYHKAMDLDPRRSVAVKACLERLQQNVPPDDD